MTAKTTRAKHLFGPDKTLVVNCQSCEEPSLDEYTGQKCIVLDEATPQMCVHNKVLMQATAQGVILRQSKTQMYARRVNLYGVAIVVCTNEWRKQEDTSAEAEWLRKNSYCVKITSPMYRGPE